MIIEQQFLKLTNVNIFSDCVIKATLDHPNFFIASAIPISISASLDTVLRNSGNILSLERRGDEDPGDIYKNIYIKMYACNHKLQLFSHYKHTWYL